MLASLTGLLLTLGGDQPAVVFDPPLDPAIFDWDGTTLRIRPESLPLDLPFPEPLPPYSSNQKMIFNETVQIQTYMVGLDFSSGSPEDLRNRVEVWDEYYDWDGDGTIDEWEDVNVGVYGSLVPRGTVFLLASVQAIQSSYVLSIEVPGSKSPGSDGDDRIKELEERVHVLEESLESCQCASDLDGDGSVGFTDLVELISVWGPCSA